MITIPMNKLKITVISTLTLFIFLFSNWGQAQIELPEDMVKWNFKVEQKGCEATIICEIKIVDKWHIYAANPLKPSFTIPTTMELTKSPNFKTIGGIIEPTPHYEYDASIDENMYLHSGKIVMKRKIKVLSNKDFTLNGVFAFQTCDDKHCLPEHKAPFSLKIKACEGITVNERADAEKDSTQTLAQNLGLTNENEIPSTDDAKSDTENKDANTTVEPVSNTDTSKMSLWAVFFISFLSGFAALLTPCVFPMIPLTVSFFTKQSKTKAAGIRNAIIYGLSIIIIYVLLGTVITGIFGYEVLNQLSTNVWFNLIFFVMLVVFAISFMGAFEIRLPNSWANKADQASDKGGLIGIFFMALALAIISFSCTGPIVGTLIVQSATNGGIGPVIGMFGFSLALALPFTLFAAFPGWMNSLPKSGGWLNTVKVFLGFLELALAFKFLSNADMVVQAHLLEREVFLCIWIAIFGTMALYLFGKIRLPHDSPIEKLSVGRTLLATFVLTFVLYMIPGLWGAPLKLISAFPPPLEYSESPQGLGGRSVAVAQDIPEHAHAGPQGLIVFDDLKYGLDYAKKVNKPVFLDFTGFACVNCRKMEQQVWGERDVIDILKNDVVVVSLFVDDKRELPKSEQKTVSLAGRERTLVTIGDKWSHLQASKYANNSQPYYRFLSPDGKDLPVGAADYQNFGSRELFLPWLRSGLDSFKESQKK